MRVRDLTLLILILGVGLGLRVMRVNTNSLTFDEQWHLELSTGHGTPHMDMPGDVLIADAPNLTSLQDAAPIYKIWTEMGGVVHPPLYCTLLRVWRDVFGESDAAARMLSISFSLLAIALLFFLVRSQFGVGPAAWAALLLAVAPTQIFVDEQVREYTLLKSMCLASAIAMFWAIRTDRKLAYALFGLGVAGMMLSHYFAIGVAGAFFVYILLQSHGRVRVRLIVAMFGAAILFSIVWLPLMIQQIINVRGADNWLVDTSPHHLIETTVRILSWPIRFAVNFSTASDAPLLGPFWPALAGGMFIAPLFFIRKRPAILFWYLWLLGTLGFVGGLDLFRGTAHLKFARYVSLASPADFVLFTAMLWLGSRWFAWTRHAAPALLTIVCLLCYRDAYAMEEPDWRTLGAAIDQHVHPGEPLIFYPGGHQPEWYARILYLCAGHYSQAFPHSTVFITNPAQDSLMRSIHSPTAWLISGRLDRSPSVLLPGTTTIEQFSVPPLAICTHVRLWD